MRAQSRSACDSVWSTRAERISEPTRVSLASHLLEWSPGEEEPFDAGAVKGDIGLGVIAGSLDSLDDAVTPVCMPHAVTGSESVCGERLLGE